MTKEEFITTLKNDKYIADPEETIKYRLPVVQYYLNNYTNSILPYITLQGPVQISSRLVEIIYDPRDFTLLNQAYISILEQFKQGVFNE